MKEVAVILVFVFSFHLKAQTVERSVKPENTSKKCISEGSILVDAYYGFPNLYSTIFKDQIISLNTKMATTSNNYYSIGTVTNVNNIGPLGGKMEYLLTEKFGLGFEFNYSNVNVSFTRVANYLGANPITYHYTYGTPAYRAMLGFNFHFLTTDIIDVYGAVKAGYYNRSFSYTTDEPGFRVIFSDPLPVAFRLEMGMRYFFTDFLGAHVNIGLGGGPLIALGLSAKF